MLKTLISFHLAENLSCEKICSGIQNLVNSYNQEQHNLANYVLVCELKKITDSDQYLLPRIGVKYE